MMVALLVVAGLIGCVCAQTEGTLVPVVLPVLGVPLLVLAALRWA